MTANKYTPGPWSLDIGANQVHVIAGRSAVARVMHGRPDGAANAHLIAASPAMYEALQEILGVEVCSPEGGHEEVAQMHRIARAAIALATGGAE